MSEEVMTAASAIRVLIADDHALVRIALRLTLELGGRYAIVGEAHDGTQVLPMLAGLQPSLIVLDPGMPGTPHEQVIREAKQMRPEVKSSS